MKKITNNIFQILVIILLSWIAYSVHSLSNNGRYELDYVKIFDTKTGAIYIVGSETEPAKLLMKGIE